jgi:hypothetical protein
MRIEENEASGESVLLGPGDALADVPRSHLHLLTTPLVEAFADPATYFADIATRCSFPEMKRWLLALLEKPRWELQLHQGYDEDWTAAGFYWSSKKVRGATISLPVGTVSGFPDTLQDYYALVDVVDWMGFGTVGQFSGARNHETLADTYQLDFQPRSIDPSAAHVMGASPCGNLLIWTRDGKGGWIDHETGDIKIIGTIEATIDSVYRALNANQCPDIDVL